MGQLQITSAGRIKPGVGVKLTAAKLQTALRRREHARQDFEQFTLAIARHTGQTDDFTGAQLQADIGQRGDRSGVDQLQALRR